MPSRPKPEPQQGWKWPLTFSWLLKISLRLISDAASSNLEYCGTLCASIGLAARWSYWPKWVGPRGREEWIAVFVQQEVRGRGEGRDPWTSWSQMGQRWPG